MEIVPTILTSDIDEFSRKLNLVKGIVPRVQIDIIDGKFAENKTIGIREIREIGVFRDIKIDLHFMVKEPIDWIVPSMELLPDRIIGQVEMMSDPMKFISEVTESGTQAGIALDLETPISIVSDEIYHSVDLVLLLAAKAGLSGQEFQPKVLEKIKKIKEIVGDLVDIGVDCGLNTETVGQSIEAGAKVFYVNHFFWEVLEQQGSASAYLLGKRYNELLNLKK